MATSNSGLFIYAIKSSRVEVRENAKDDITWLSERKEMNKRRKKGNGKRY